MTTNTQLPQYVHDLLASQPPRGQGLNNWFYRVALSLHPFRSEAEIIALLAAATAGEPLQAGEVERAVRRSKATARQTGATTAPIRRTPKWPTVDQEQRNAIIASGFELYDLWENSPIRFDPSDRCTEQIVDALFPGNPWLCVGTAHSFKTRRREELRGQLASLPQIVPSPMKAQTGLTQDGKVSEHTLEATGSRRFLIVEQDSGTLDEQAAILTHLAERAPLALVVHSGGKSLHGWFVASGYSEDLLHQFMRRCVALGADPALWTRSQLARMPDGTRDTGERQKVYFFNPEVLP